MFLYNIFLQISILFLSLYQLHFSLKSLLQLLNKNAFLCIIFIKSIKKNINILHYKINIYFYNLFLKIILLFSVHFNKPF